MSKPLTKEQTIARCDKYNHSYIEHYKNDDATWVVYLCGNCGARVTNRVGNVKSCRCLNCRRVNRAWNDKFIFPSQMRGYKNARAYRESYQGKATD